MDSGFGRKGVRVRGQANHEVVSGERIMERQKLLFKPFPHLPAPAKRAIVELRAHNLAKRGPKKVKNNCISEKGPSYKPFPHLSAPEEEGI